MYSASIKLESLFWDFTVHCHHKYFELLHVVPLYIWYPFVLYNLQWDNMATMLYLIHISISFFPSCTLITLTPLIDGIRRMKNLRYMALELSLDVRTQQSTPPGPLKQLRVFWRTWVHMMSWKIPLDFQKAIYRSNGVVSCWQRLYHSVNIRGCHQNGNFPYLQGVDNHHHPCLHVAIISQELGMSSLFQI